VLVEGGADHVMPPRLPKDLPKPARASASPGPSARHSAAMAANRSEARRLSPLVCFSMTWIWGPSGAADRGMDNDRNDESGDAGLLILARAAPTVA